MAWSTPRTWVTGEIVTATLLNTELRDNLLSVYPIGSYLLWATPYITTEQTFEGRWLQCNGVAVSRTTYANLFAYLNIQTPALPFGVGDGVTTFNLPDLRGRIVIAEGEHTTVDAMGDNEGMAIANRSPEHRHEVDYGGSGGDGSVLGDVSLGGVTAGQITTKTTDTASLPVDTPAYLVAGSYFIKYS